VRGRRAPRQRARGDPVEIEMAEVMVLTAFVIALGWLVLIVLGY
jgi:hypothetical protein